MQNNSNSIESFLAELKADGVVVYLQDGKLRTRGAADVVALWKAEMLTRKNELLAYFQAQGAQYIDPIQKYDTEDTGDEIAESHKKDAWDTEGAWGYYQNAESRIQYRKEKCRQVMPIPSSEIARIGRMINLAHFEQNMVKFKSAVDAWFDAYSDMIDQVEQGTWQGELPWELAEEATALYGRTMRLIEYAYLTIPIEERPNRRDPDLLAIEEEIATCFKTRDFEALQDACTRLTKTWRALGLVVKFK
jgi:hypothetical protein